MAETSFNKRFRNELTERFKFDFYRIESHATCPGIPDNHFLFMGAAGWIEMKECATEPRKIAYRPQQAGWLQTYSKRGGIACTLVHIRDTDVVLYVPGSESLAAEKDMSRCLGVRRVSLKEPEGWKRIAKLVLGNKVGG